MSYEQFAVGLDEKFGQSLWNDFPEVANKGDHRVFEGRGGLTFSIKVTVNNIPLIPMLQTLCGKDLVVIFELSTSNLRTSPLNCWY